MCSYWGCGKYFILCKAWIEETHLNVEYEGVHPEIATLKIAIHVATCSYMYILTVYVHTA